MSPPPSADDDRTQVVPPPKSGGDTPAAEAGATELDFDPTMIAPPPARPAASAEPAYTPVPTPAPTPVPSAAAGPTSSAPKPGASASSAGDSGNALPVGTYLSEFELTGVIGEGGFGIVYHAWDHSLQRKVALKEYMPASLASREKSFVQVRSLRHKETFDAGLKSFINEARLLAQFDHPSLVKVYRFWEANGTAYMVMPLYEGTTLKDRLRQMNGKPDEAWLMGVLAPLTDALAVIHKENCFHRDIAPDNVILLAGSERPLLLDFGAARRVIGDMTQALTVILKPGYAPVEQYAESPDMKQGAWTDVYALAATVHWAIMGKTPPPSVSRLMNDSFQPVSKTAAGRYSERFLSAIDRALAVRPENRTSSIAALRADIGLDGGWGAAGMPAVMAQPFMTPTASPMANDAYAPTQMAGPASGGTGLTGMATVMAPRPVSPERADELTMIAPRNAAGAFEKTQLAQQTRAAAAAGEAPAGVVPARTPAPPAEAARAGGNKSMVWIGVAAVVLVAAGVGGYMAMGRKDPTPAPQAAAPAATPAAASPSPAMAGSAVGTAPAPAPAAAPASFSLREQLDKVMGSQTAGFVVNAIPAKTQLRIGKDNLTFDVTSSRDGHVHILLRGPDGSLTLMFPNDQARDSRIKAGQRLKLPHASWPLVASEPAGTEQFLIFVSAVPRDYSEFQQEKEYIFHKLPVDQRAQALANNWKRSTPLLVGAPQAGCQGASCDEYGAATFTVQVLP